jgi:hypothetical protein
MLRKKVEDEKLLIGPNDLDVGSPEYFTELFSLFNQLLDKALLEPSDIQQIESYLQSLAQADFTFKCRKATNGNGQVVGVVCKICLNTSVSPAVVGLYWIITTCPAQKLVHGPRCLD